MKIAVVHGLTRGGAHRRLNETLKNYEGDIKEFILSDADSCTCNPEIVRVRSFSNQLPYLFRPPFRYVDFFLRRLSYRRLSRKVRSWDPDAVFMNPCRSLKSPPLEKSLLQKSVFWLDELPRSLEIQEFMNTTRPLTRAIYAPLRFLLRRNNRNVVSKAAVVLTSSRYMADLISEVYRRPVAPEKCGVSREFSCDSEVVKRGHVISVGSLIPGKGHDLTIESLGKSGLGLPLVIVTHRPVESEMQRLNQLANKVGVDVTFQFGISDHELAGLFQSAVFTSYLATLEPFGLVSIESQACGTPALVSKEGGLPETIIEGVTGLSVIRDAPSVAAAMREIAVWSDSPETRKACCDFGQSWQWSETAISVSQYLEQVAQ